MFQCLYTNLTATIVLVGNSLSMCVMCICTHQYYNDVSKQLNCVNNCYNRIGVLQIGYDKHLCGIITLGGLYNVTGPVRINQSILLLLIQLYHQK